MPYEREVMPWFDKALAMTDPDPKLMASIYQEYGRAEYTRMNWDKAILLYKTAYQYDPERFKRRAKERKGAEIIDDDE